MKSASSFCLLLSVVTIVGLLQPWPHDSPPPGLRTIAALSPALRGLPALLEFCADIESETGGVVTCSYRSPFSVVSKTGPGLSGLLRSGFGSLDSQDSRASSLEPRLQTGVEIPTACLIPGSPTLLPPPTQPCVILKSVITSNHRASTYLTRPFVS